MIRSNSGFKLFKKTLSAMFLAALCLTGCAPTQATSVKRGPDFTVKEDVRIDFDQLHNDTLEAFGDATENPYVYIDSLDISGDNDTKSVVVDAVCMDDTSKAEAEQFAAAVLRHMDDAAAIQSMEYEQSTQESFGSFYDKYALTITVRPESTKDDAATYLINLKIDAGGSIPFDPNIEAYEEEWADTRDQYLEELSSHIVLDGSSQGDAAETEEEAETAAQAHSRNSVD